MANWHSVCGLLLLLFSTAASAQTVSGYVRDMETNEAISYASLLIPVEKKGVACNRFGFFSLSTGIFPAFIEVSSIGYEKTTVKISSHSDSTLTIFLKPVSKNLNEVEVKTSSAKDAPDEIGLGRFRLFNKSIQKSPALLGENDILKTLQLLPGVQGGIEGTTGLNIRGGTPDQTLILLDGMPLYNVNHLFGFLSVINPDAVSSVELFKSSIPARYGGRLSGVLDLQMREGNMNHWQGNFALSPISGRLLAEGPVVKGKSSILLSARKSWIDALIWLGAKVAGTDEYTALGFYDLNLKWNYKLSAKDWIYASFYTGRDNFRSEMNDGAASQYRYAYHWGNTTTALRWNRVWNKRLFSNTSLHYINYDYGLTDNYRQSNQYYRNIIRSGIQDFTLKTDFELTASTAHLFRFGIGIGHHSFRPELQQQVTSIDDPIKTPANPIRSDEITAYVEDEWKLTDRIGVSAGLHLAAQTVQGRNYSAFQPRLSGRYLLSNGSAFKASYARMAQFIHLLSNSSLGLASDLWVPVTSALPPETADSWSVGYSKNWQSGWTFSTEGYYKRMQNVIEYRRSANVNLQDPAVNWADRVTTGSSISKGLEFFLERTKGRTKGWLSYTLSRTDRTFADINEGKSFPFKYDRRHHIALYLSRELTPRKSLSLNFIYTTGMAVTLASARYPGWHPSTALYNGLTASNWYENTPQSYFENLSDLNQRNNYRAPAYHRLDLSYQVSKQKRHGERTWILSVYNAYSRNNPLFLYYNQKKLMMASLFPIIPSITYQYAFR